MFPTHEPVAALSDTRIERRQMTADLFEQADHDGSTREEALQRIIVLHLPTARSIARRYRDRGVELDDLEQTACIALVQAVRGFDPSLGFGFLAFAVPTIRGAVRRHFRDYGWMVRPPRGVQELQPKVRTLALERDPVTGRSLTVEQMAAQLDTSTAAVREAAQASGCFTPMSLEAPADSGKSDTLMDRLPGDRDPGFDVVESRDLLDSVISGLDPWDRRLIQMRFLDERTQQDMADELGLTQSQVSRRLAHILAVLRRLLAVDDELVEAAC